MGLNHRLKIRVNGQMPLKFDSLTERVHGTPEHFRQAVDLSRIKTLNVDLADSKACAQGAIRQDHMRIGRRGTPNRGVPRTVTPLFCFVRWYQSVMSFRF